ncbi:MAG: hypothetical protein ACPGSB_00730 [Opitutales bacterium]
MRKEPSGESFLKLHMLGPELGIQLCLKRISTKKLSQKASPDLFDTADIQLDRSKHGTALFISDYHIQQRRSEIGSNYRALCMASELSNLFVENGGHMADLPALYQLAEHSLDAFASKLEPSVVYLKSLYVLLRDEGYPVRESWWPQVPTKLRTTTRELLKQPSPPTLTLESREYCEASIQHLQNWLIRETDLNLPEEKM